MPLSRSATAATTMDMVGLLSGLSEWAIPLSLYESVLVGQHADRQRRPIQSIFITIFQIPRQFRNQNSILYNSRITRDLKGEDYDPKNLSQNYVKSGRWNLTPTRPARYTYHLSSWRFPSLHLGDRISYFIKLQCCHFKLRDV